MEQDLLRTKDVSWMVLNDLVEKLKQFYGEQLLTFFVYGSTAENDFKLNQDVDFFVVVKDQLIGENYQEIEEKLKLAWVGQLEALEPSVPDEVRNIFEQVSAKYRSDDLEIVTKFAAGPYFPKPIKKITIHLHAVAPISLGFFLIWSRIFPFHALTIYHKAKVLYGADPLDLIKIQPTKEDLNIWLTAIEKRIQKAQEIGKTDKTQAVLIVTKAIIQSCMTVLAYRGIYENDSKKVITLFPSNFTLPLSSLPSRAYMLKKNPQEVVDNANNFDQFMLEGKKFISDLKNFYQLN